MKYAVTFKDRLRAQLAQRPAWEPPEAVVRAAARARDLIDEMAISADDIAYFSVLIRDGKVSDEEGFREVETAVRTLTSEFVKDGMTERLAAGELAYRALEARR